MSVSPRDKFRRGLAWTLALLMLGEVAGCVRFPTDAQRETSFQEHRTLRVEGLPAEGFIAARTAVLIASKSLRLDDSDESGATVQFELPPNSKVLHLDQSLAVAIDPRGYFLTAYHCIQEDKQVIVYPLGPGQRMARPRVVASLPELDMAIIAVDSVLSGHFQWLADPIPPGTAVLLCGTGAVPLSGQTLTVNRQCLGGVVTGVSAVNGGVAIKHTAPTRPGDSGGPALDREGRLVGISSHILVRPFLDSVNVAIRPDPAVISRLIEADFEKRRGQ